MAKKPYEPPTYGVRHVMEGEMRSAGNGVFGIKNRGGAPANKARKAAPEDKAEPSMDMLKDELLDMAKSEGVDVESDDNKADLVRKIKAARK